MDRLLELGMGLAYFGYAVLYHFCVACKAVVVESVSLLASSKRQPIDVLIIWDLLDNHVVIVHL
jgi:hypothetical protein